MQADEFGLLALARHWLRDDFSPVEPTGLLKESLEIGGITFEVKQLGAGEAPCVDVLYLPDAGALFAADVVFNGMTPFLAEGRTRRWLEQLDLVSALFPNARTIYPGHGAPSDAALLIRQTREYITWFRALLEVRRTGSVGLTPEIRAAIVAQIEGRYPGYLPVAAIPDITGMNVDAVWRELENDLSNRY
jgi:glyoxylase-like metal-dependent hydrolase (beta-lactamase superfamily II)